MTNRLVALLLIGSLLSCSSEEERPTSEDLSILSEELNPTQHFRIKPQADTTIVGEQGTRVFIPANTLVDVNGNQPGGRIDLELKEVYSKSEMIFNGLSTTSNGNLLETSGMIRLSAYGDDTELEIKEGSAIRIGFMRISDNPNMRTYLADFDSTSLNWLLDNNNVLDTIYFTVAEDRILTLDYGADSVAPFPITYGVVAEDTFEVLSTVTDSDVLDVLPDSVYSTGFEIDSSYYWLHSTELKWINCDYFVLTETMATARIGPITTDFEMTYLIFEDINALMQSWEVVDGKKIFRNIPLGSKANILAIRKEGSDYSIAKGKTVLNSEQEDIELDYVPSSLEGIRATIESSN